MEKVKLTQEQANIISNISLDELGEWFYKDERTNTDMYAALKDFTMEEIAKAKIEGYEVKPEFKVGDWVIRTLDMGKSHEKGRVFKVASVDDWENIYADDGGPNHLPRSLRHATPEEIAKEKRRRWWSKHNRGLWELREGDALKAVDGGHLVEVCEVFDSRF